MQLPDLHDEATRTIIAWAGGVLVTVVGGIWTLFKFMKSERKKREDQSPSVHASQAAVAAGRDIRDSKIEVHTRDE
jgi:hypothetical protein